MTTDHRITKDDVLDAIAFLEAMAHGDVEGRNAIARACNPANLVDVISLMHLRVIAMHPRPDEHFAWLRKHADRFLDHITYPKDGQR